eukprot:Tbor_TRINITY_DN6026_c1_g1::TRINITY_DN6026_c1_g1_i5::g.10439::m.10439
MASGECGYHTVPGSHKTKGVPEADYVLYVSAAPTGTKAVAWASFCGQDSQGRPITGRANFRPNRLVWKDLDKNGQRKLIGTAVHELMHALGFDNRLWSKFFPTGNPIAS